MLDRRLARLLPDSIEALTVRERGWGSLKNGELLGAAQHEFDVLLTADRDIPQQQNLSRYELTVVVLRVRGNSFEDLSPLMTQVSKLLCTVRPGEAVFVENRSAGRLAGVELSGQFFRVGGWGLAGVAFTEVGGWFVVAGGALG